MANPEKGFIEGIGTGIKVEFLFNPTKYSISKTNNWNSHDTKGENVAPLEFGGGGNRELKLDLFFDKYEEGESIEKYLNDLWKLMEIDENKKNRDTNKGEPPKCRLQMGKWLSFKCVITRMSHEYLLFKPDGTPVRAKVSLSLKEAKIEESRGQNPTSRGLVGRKSRRISPGERLDWIAFQEYGDPSLWKEIARENDMADPTRIEPGEIISLPDL